ncbi:TPA: hypothetical protein ACGW44_002621 [Bacillus toyonensis]
MVKEIPLPNDMVAIVDDEDYERCMKYLWYVRSPRGNVGAVSNNKGVSLGKFILNIVNSGSVVIYKNNNKLDC